MSSELNRREVLQGAAAAGVAGAVAPAAFFSHGSPVVALDSDAYPQALRAFGASVPTVADAARGLDHGAWVPLRLAFPEAKLPVVQVSIPRGAPAEALVRSGGITHNLRRFSWEKQAPVESWAAEFDAWVAERVASRQVSGLLGWEHAPYARVSHPSAEHFLPLFFVLGAALPEDRLTPVFEGIHHGTLSMRSFALRR